MTLAAHLVIFTLSSIHSINPFWQGLLGLCLQALRLQSWKLYLTQRRVSERVFVRLLSCANKPVILWKVIHCISNCMEQDQRRWYLSLGTLFLYIKISSNYLNTSRLNTTSFSWESQVKHFARTGKHSVLVFDNRGVGNSDTPRGPYSCVFLSVQLCVRNFNEHVGQSGWRKMS